LDCKKKRLVRFIFSCKWL